MDQQLARSGHAPQPGTPDPLILIHIEARCSPGILHPTSQPTNKAGSRACRPAPHLLPLLEHKAAEVHEVALAGSHGALAPVEELRVGGGRACVYVCLWGPAGTIRLISLLSAGWAAWARAQAGRQAGRGRLLWDRLGECPSPASLHHPNKRGFCVFFPAVTWCMFSASSSLPVTLPSLKATAATGAHALFSTCYRGASRLVSQGPCRRSFLS